MDTQQLVRDTTLYLPMGVEGALFSCGDAHAAQGDGEVCVTGIEAPMHGELRFTLQKGRRIPAPQYQTTGPLTPRVDAGGWYRDDGGRARPWSTRGSTLLARCFHLRYSRRGQLDGDPHIPGQEQRLTGPTATRDRCWE